MRIAGIVRDSIVDGVGIRDVIFFQGCLHKCVGCQNPTTWNLEGGIGLSPGEVAFQLANSKNEVTISGGEPLLQLFDLKEMLSLLNKRAWLYTGYQYEDISYETWSQLYALGVEVVVDGKFEKELADKSLKFKGSKNQRIIDLKQTLKFDKVVLWEDSNDNRN